VVEDTVMGMDLPYKGHAVVEREKVRDYLLSPSHPTGKGKAEFFTSMGFQREAWEVFADALRQMARNCSVTKKHDIPSRAEVYCRRDVGHAKWAAALYPDGVGC
jgi:hypothetical protein